MSTTRIPTPRTDAAAGHVLDSTPVHAQGFEPDPDGSYVPVDVARQLEQDLIAARAQLAEFRAFVEVVHAAMPSPESARLLGHSTSAS